MKYALGGDAEVMRAITEEIAEGCATKQFTVEEMAIVVEDV